MSLKYMRPEKRKRMELLLAAANAEDYETARKIANANPKERDIIHPRANDLIGPQNNLDVNLIPLKSRIIVYDTKKEQWWLSAKECVEFYKFKSSYSFNHAPWCQIYDVTSVYCVEGFTGTAEELSEMLGMTVSNVRKACHKGRRGQVIDRIVTERI